MTIADIDNTIASEGVVNPQIMDRIAGLMRLNPGKAVIFATGRSSNSFDKMVLKELKKRFINDSALNLAIESIILIARNGCEIFRYSYKDGEISKELVHEILLENSNAMFCKIKERFGGNLVLEGSDFVAKATRYGIVLPTRKRVENDYIKTLKDFLQGLGFEGFKVLKTGENTIDIVPKLAGKESAISALISSGVIFTNGKTPVYGDQYKPNGNDHGMLNMKNITPVSVNSPLDTLNHLCNSDLDSSINIPPNCIIDPRNNPKFPSRGEVPLGEKFTIDSLIKHYSQIEESVRCKYLRDRGSWANMKDREGIFEEINLNDLRFSFGGGLSFTEEDFNSLKENRNLQSFIGMRDRFFVDYGKGDDKRIYSRGYSYVSGDEKILPGLDHNTRLGMMRDDLIRLININPLITKILDSEETISMANYKILLSYSDNLKNLCLHIYHAIGYLKFEGFIDSIEDSDVKNLIEDLKELTLYAVDSYFAILNLKKPYEKEISSRAKDKIKEATNIISQVITSEPENKRAQKSVRGIIEADIPEQVNIFARRMAKDIVEKYKDSGRESRKIVLAGAHFGGVELPFAVYQELRRSGFDMSRVEILSVFYSRYSNPKNADDNKNIKDSPMLSITDLSHKDVYLLDDAPFTARTLSIIANEISRLGGNVILRTMQIGPVTRRPDQVLGSGVARPTFIEGQIAKYATGVTPSPRQRVNADLQKYKPRFSLARCAIARRFPSNKIV
jgi:HAD superfamily hydrolase (TIGR01484 family)